MRTLVVVSALIHQGGRYLFIKQNKLQEAYPGTLHLPGGKLENDENPAEAIIREIKEEISVQVTNLKMADFDWDTTSYKGEMTRFIFLRFTAELKKGEPVPGSDAAEVVWIPKAELAKEHLNSPTIRMLRNLHLV